jgi:uncharacterized protein (TIGR00304 family)
MDVPEVRPISFVPICLLAAGLSLVVVSVANGEADVSLVVIFPVISGSGSLFLIGVALVVMGILSGFMLIVATSYGAAPDSGDSSWGDAGGGTGEKGSKYGGVILIGPIPIVFGSNAKIAYVMLAVAVGIVIFVLALALLALR